MVMRTIALVIMVIVTLLSIIACCLPAVITTSSASGVTVKLGFSVFTPDEPISTCSVDGVSEALEKETCENAKKLKVQDQCGSFARSRSTAAFAVLAAITAAASSGVLLAQHLPAGKSLPGIAGVVPVAITSVFSLIAWAVWVGTFNMSCQGAPSMNDGGASLGPMPIMLIVAWVLTLPAAGLAFAAKPAAEPTTTTESATASYSKM